MWISAFGVFTTGLTAVEADNDEPSSNVLFVDASGSGINNGSSWAKAYTGVTEMP